MFNSCPPAGAQVPITSYVCTQPNFYHTLTDSSLCNVSSGLRTCETEGGVCPTLLVGDTRGDSGAYIWTDNTKPFVVLDVPKDGMLGVV